MSISKDYQAQMAAEHDGSKWGSTAAKYSGDRVTSILRSRPWCHTVLDFGCGKQSLEKYVTANLGRDVQWTNYDPAISGINTLPKGTFDFVVSTDVIEHIEPKLLDETLQQLYNLTGNTLVSDIACYPTGKVFMEGPYKGQDMHLIVETPNWWREKLNALALEEFTWEHIERRKKGSTKARCFMVHERV